MKSKDLRGQDVIDSRDIISRLDDLEGMEEAVRDELENADDEGREDAQAEYDAFVDEYGDELEALRELVNDASRTPDWQYGVTLIHDDYFEEYAEELAEDIGTISRNATWPLTHIDWKAAAEALQQDYFSVDFDGDEYWIRG